MSPHRFDPDSAEKLEDTSRFRYLSRDELVGALSPDHDAVIADVGSGTGFFTREVAPFVGEIHAIDMQAEMHTHLESQGVPANVLPVLAKADDLPFGDGFFDGIYSTFTLHEYDEGGVPELFRVLRSGGRLVVADWSATGSGERGPPLEERLDTSAAADTISEAGFEIETARSRPETFIIEAMSP